MTALLILLSVVAVSIVITRVATVALVHTGLTPETARLQARSAFTGTGFTTQESENVVRHPVRRRILMLLMLLGNAGLVTVITTLVLSFVDTERGPEAVRRGAVLVLGVAGLVLLARSDWVNRHMTRLIDWALERYTDITVADFYRLLNLEEGYAVSRLPVREDSWLAGRAIQELDLPDEGVLILAITREDGTYVGAPRGRYMIHPGDTLILYGEAEQLAELNRRLADEAGQAERARQKRRHRERLEEQDAGQRKHEERRTRLSL